MREVGLLGHIRVLEAVARTSSVTAAADYLGMAKSSVSARLRELEKLVGAKLLSRSRRGMRTTQAGEMLLSSGQRLLREAEAAIAQIRGRENALEGLVRIACPTGIADSILVPMLAEFLRAHPKLDLSVLASDEIIDPTVSGVDVAFRFGWLQRAEEHLIVYRIGAYRGYLCCSPGYIEASANNLGSPRELLAHRWIGFSGFGSGAQALRLRHASGGREEVVLTPHILTTSATQCKQWALAGAGITRLPALMIAAELASGALVQVLPDYGFENPALFAVYPRDRHRPARVRALLEHLRRRRVFVESSC